MRPHDRVRVEGRPATVVRGSAHGVTVRYDDVWEPCAACGQQARVEETFHADAVVLEVEQLRLGGAA